MYQYLHIYGFNAIKISVTLYQYNLYLKCNLRNIYWFVFPLKHYYMNMYYGKTQKIIYSYLNESDAKINCKWNPENVFSGRIHFPDKSWFLFLQIYSIWMMIFIRLYHYTLIDEPSEIPFIVQQWYTNKSKFLFLSISGTYH